jgi:type VI secretion system secreted protein VgrG
MPTAPELAEDADVADPGKVSEVRAEQIQQQKMKYGSSPIKPHKPPASPAQAEEEGKTSWIEIELVDEEKRPIPGERYKITLPDNSVADGTLDEKGFAKVDGIQPGTCQITFPELDKDAWAPA